MKLFITLSPEEVFNFKEWVKMGKADPAFAAHPWKVVLQERTQARFDEIAPQFDAPVQAGAPTTVDLRNEFTAAEKDSDGQNNRVVNCWPSSVLVIPLRVPAGPFPVSNIFGCSIAEYGSPPAIRQMTLTRKPGDFSEWPRADSAFSVGNQASISVSVGPGGLFAAGELVYANVREWDASLNNGAGGTSVQADRLDKPATSRFSATWPR